MFAFTDVSQNLLDQTVDVYFLLQSEKSGTIDHIFMTVEARIEQLRRQPMTDVDINRKMVAEVIGEVERITLCEDTEEVLDLSREYYEIAKSSPNIQIFGYDGDGRSLWTNRK